MRYLPDGNWMQKADEHTIQNIGIASIVLMERAALRVVEFLETYQLDTSKTLIVCGAGNNGGDGFAIARLLKQQGKNVCAVFIGKEERRSTQCQLQMEIAEKIGVPIVTALPKEEYTVIIDAIFGVGLSREIQGEYAKVLEQLNAMSGQKVAVDIPSGICSKTGKVLGIAFRAKWTVSFACEKLGTVLFPGCDYAGEVLVAEIGIDPAFFKDRKEVCYTLDREDLERLLPARSANSHKGTYGKVLMIVGSKGMAGAAYLSAKAAYISGAGLVQIYTHESNRMILQQLLPEAIISTYTTYEATQLHSLLNWADVVCIGCGIGVTDVARKIVEDVIQLGTCPCVVDADGLNLLSENLSILKGVKRELVLTPHMKEMSRLLGCSIEELSKQRFQLLQEFVEKYGVVCALKDARTIVAEKEHSPFVNTAGNSAMAKAGSGDVLAGTIAGFLAQRMNGYEGAVLGVYLHACGGDDARNVCGQYSVLAEDLLEGIKYCIASTKKGR